MTALETERLIRKMSELLQQGGSTDSAAKLAGEFSAACHAANIRLQQCEAMLKAGDEHQAIQLAETAPNLHDLVTLLEFRNSDDWRNFCQQNALPVAERIDSHSIRSLNECYERGITTDHPLYAAYRKAVLSRNDEEALRILQSISRLNPSDTSAATELARLDAKVIAARLDQLAGLLQNADTQLVVAAVETIEAFNFKTSPEGEVWCKAQVLRCGLLVEQVAQLKASMRWPDALAKLDFIRHLETEFKLELPGKTSEQVRSFEAWARGEKEKDRKEREFRALIAELHFRVQQSEEKDTSARYVKLPELRDDFEALNKVWRSLTDFTRPIPEDATVAFRKRAALLEAEIMRRTAIRRRTIFASSAAGLVLGGVIVWFVLGQMRSRDFAEQIRAAVSQRQVHAAEQLLKRIHTGEKQLLSVGSANVGVASAESFLTKERALLTNFESAFARLPTPMSGNPDAARLNAIAEQLSQARTALTALAPDLKAENEPRVQAFEKLWRQFLSEGGVAVNTLLDEWIRMAEKQCAQLDYRAPVETAVSQLAKLSDVLQKINNYEAGFAHHVTLRNDLLQRAAIIRTKFAAYDREMKKLDEGMVALQKARTFKDFSEAISLIASSEFSGSLAASAATEVQSLGVSDEATLRFLLGATNAATWAFITREKPMSLIPEIAMPAERAFFQRLDDDPAIAAKHFRYRLWLDRESTSSLEWVTAGSLDNSQGWKQIRAWTVSPSHTTVVFESKEYGFFDGQWKLSPTQPVYRLEQAGSLQEAIAYSRVGLAKVWSGGSLYGGPLLEVLDVIKTSREGSPVFRAYLFCSLVEIMEFQTDAWGLSFCPSAKTHTAQIRIITGGQITSGDWFLPKAKAWSEKLDEFFAGHASMSYMKQAMANLALARAVAKDGLRYAGFVGLDGKPVITANPAPAEIWCYDGKRKHPTLVSGSAMPLSPLFALRAPRAEYATKAGVTTDAASYTDALPPLFIGGFKP